MNNEEQSKSKYQRQTNTFQDIAIMDQQSAICQSVEQRQQQQQLETGLIIQSQLAAAAGDLHAKIDGLMAQAAEATIAHFQEWKDFTLRRSHHIVSLTDDKLPKPAGEHNEEWEDCCSAHKSVSSNSYSSPSGCHAVMKRRPTKYPRETGNKGEDCCSANKSVSSNSYSSPSACHAIKKRRPTKYPRETRNPFYTVPAGRRRVASHAA